MKKLTKILTAALIGAMAVGCGGGNSSSAPVSGSLDKSFGDKGKVITGNGGYDEINSILSNSDGTIYVCGATKTATHGLDTFLSKYSQKGNLVSSFGTNGTIISNTAKDDKCLDIAKDSSGNIYIVGVKTDSSNQERGYISKFNSDGTYIGMLELPAVSKLEAAAMQNGKILIAGQHNHKAYIARVNSNGTIDTAFGNNGSLEIGNGTTNDEIKDIALNSSGEIVIAGKTVSNGNENIAIAKLTANGQFENSFGNNGGVIYDSGDDDKANAVAVDSNGQIILTGSSGDNMVLIKLNSNGSYDTSFGNSAIVKYTALPWSIGFDLVIDKNDNILITGLAGQNWSSVNASIWRYSINGTPDKSFNKSGIALFNGGYNKDIGLALTLDNSDKILAGGSSYQGNSKGWDEVIWRINP